MFNPLGTEIRSRTPSPHPRIVTQDEKVAVDVHEQHEDNVQHEYQGVHGLALPRFNKLLVFTLMMMYFVMVVLMLI